MKIRRKTSYCLNCGLDLDRNANFCQRCGQENTDNNVSFGTLAHDFVSNYFSWDGRFGRSVIPFLFKPGRLTNEFISGRRKTYMHPVRLYLVLSLVFFTVVTFYAKDQVSEDFKAVRVKDKNTEGKLAYSIKDEDGKKKRNLVFVDKNNDTLVNEALDISGNLPGNFAQWEDSLMTKIDSSDTETDTVKKESSWVVTEAANFPKVLQLMENKNLSEAEILDSAQLKEGSSEYFFVRQYIRINRADNKVVVAAIIKNLPIMMFLLMPIFALILKLLYVRRDSLYIHHLVHAIHIHSFLYLILLLLVVVYWTGFLKSVLIPLLMGALIVYLFISFKKVYKQGFIKTLLKVSFLAFNYAILLVVAFGVEMLISLALY